VKPVYGVAAAQSYGLLGPVQLPPYVEAAPLAEQNGGSVRVAPDDGRLLRATRLSCLSEPITDG
jgi:hypothetical protein